MAEPITKLEELSDAQRRVIEANAGNELIPVKRDARGVITEYRQMSPQEYLTSLGGVTKAGYYGKDIAEGRGMSDEEYFGLLKKGGVELLNATNEARVREGETKKLVSRYLSEGLSQAEAEDACIRGIQKAFNQVYLVWGDKIGTWFEQFMELGDLMRKVDHPIYLPELGYKHGSKPIGAENE